jgi:hypothetical protein
MLSREEAKNCSFHRAEGPRIPIEVSLPGLGATFIHRRQNDGIIFLLEVCCSHWSVLYDIKPRKIRLNHLLALASGLRIENVAICALAQIMPEIADLAALENTKAPQQNS